MKVRAWAAALAASVLVVACQSAAPPPPGPSAVPSDAVDVALDPQVGAIEITQLLSGYRRPVYVGPPPDDPDLLYVVEQDGVISVASRVDGEWRRGADVLDIGAQIISDSDPECYQGEFNNERGLLGLAFAPDHASSRLAYITYTVDAACESADRGALVLAEIVLDGDDPVSAPKRVLFQIPKPQDPDGHPRPNHNGGGIGFGPDGLLYVALGEGGNSGPEAQMLLSHWGKLLRIDPADPDGDGPQSYSVPAGNPYLSAAGALGEVWSSGLRNPWRWSFDRQTGDLWIGDVGQFRYESIDVVAADADGLNAGRGLDFGWARCEGAHASVGSRPDDPEPRPCTTGVLPIHEYSHADGRCAVLGGHVYRGTNEAWHGAYAFSDYCDGVVRVLTKRGIVVGPRVEVPLTFGELADGELVIAGQGGTIYEIVLSGSPPS